MGIYLRRLAKTSVLTFLLLFFFFSSVVFAVPSWFYPRIPLALLASFIFANCRMEIGRAMHIMYMWIFVIFGNSTQFMSFGRRDAVR